jgi:hypothetical protein
MIRDAYCCVVTGLYDRKTANNSEEFYFESPPQTFTHCAHILDESIHQ